MEEGYVTYASRVDFLHEQGNNRGSVLIDELFALAVNSLRQFLARRVHGLSHLVLQNIVCSAINV